MESPRWDAEAQAHVGVESLRREGCEPEPSEQLQCVFQYKHNVSITAMSGNPVFNQHFRF